MSTISDGQRDRSMLEQIRFSRTISEMSRFGRRDDWDANTRAGKAAATFLYPHAEDYFSVLKPVFFFQLKHVDVLTAYRPVLLRDGALGLLDLFLRHPKPPLSDAYIFVHRDLAWTVPESWKPVTAFFRVLPGATANSAPRDLYVLANVIDDNHGSVADFETQLGELGQFDTTKFQRIHVTTFAGHVFGSNVRERDTRARIAFEMTRSLVSKFGDRAEYLSWTDLQGRNLGAGAFLEFNPRRFYYADGFVSHHFLSKGAIPLKAQSLEPGELELPISLCHRYAVSEKVVCSDHQKLNSIRDEWNHYVNDPLFIREARSFRLKTAFFGSKKFCSPALEALAAHLSARVAAEGLKFSSSF